eukprot:3949362-Ditylum_brightwellii.AAC.1
MELITHVHWDVFGQAFDKLSLYSKIRVLKFQHNLLPTMACLHDIYPSKSPKFPICAHLDEDWKHLFTCSCKMACSARLHMFAKFCTGLMKSNTNRTICKVLLQINRSLDGITLSRAACPNTGLLHKQSTNAPSTQTQKSTQ